VLSDWRAQKEVMPKKPRPGSTIIGDERDLERWSIDNWNLIEPAIRASLLHALRGSIGDDLKEHWVNLKIRGLPIGAELGFHHGVGQKVRNILRMVLRDQYLPKVPAGLDGRPLDQPVSNWDDFYLGAIDALAEERLSTPQRPQAEPPSLDKDPTYTKTPKAGDA